jgi:hypothetical protein
MESTQHEDKLEVVEPPKKKARKETAGPSAPPLERTNTTDSFRDDLNGRVPRVAPPGKDARKDDSDIIGSRAGSVSGGSVSESCLDDKAAAMNKSFVHATMDKEIIKAVFKHINDRIKPDDIYAFLRREL